jgi:DNA replication protein DnaC
MLTEEHFDILARRLKIKTFAAKLKEICESDLYLDLTFEEKMVILIETELFERNSKRINKLHKQARFACPQACMEEVVYLPERSLDKDYLNRIAGGRYIDEHDHLVLISESGLGKSYVAQALGNAACRQMRSVRYIRHADMCMALNVARANGSVAYYKAMREFEGVSVLIIDDFFTAPVSEQNIIDTFEIIESRVDKGSMIIASIIEPEEWHLRIPTKTMADSLVDRLIHRATYIDIKGPNMRSYTAEQKAKTAKKKG